MFSINLTIVNHHYHYNQIVVIYHAITVLNQQIIAKIIANNIHLVSTVFDPDYVVQKITFILAVQIMVLIILANLHTKDFVLIHYTKVYNNVHNKVDH